MIPRVVTNVVEINEELYEVIDQINNVWTVVHIKSKEIKTIKVETAIFKLLNFEIITD